MFYISSAVSLMVVLSIATHNGLELMLPVFSWQTIVSLSLIFICSFVATRSWRTIEKACDFDNCDYEAPIFWRDISIIMGPIIMMTMIACNFSILAIIIVAIISGYVVAALFFGVHDSYKDSLIKPVLIFSYSSICVGCNIGWFIEHADRVNVDSSQKMILLIATALVIVGISLGCINIKRSKQHHQVLLIV